MSDVEPSEKFRPPSLFGTWLVKESAKQAPDWEMIHGARGLVPDGARVLLVEAKSKLMELKYRGAHAGGASDGAHDLLGVSVLRADTHEV